MPGSTVLTIGSFDGVHLGHRTLLARARLAAGRGGRVVALVFDPHPLSALRPGSEPARLTTFARRAELLREAGADGVERLEPSPGVLGLTPAEFIDGVVERFRPSAIVEGEDFRFGRGRVGDVRTLGALGEARGFEAIVVGQVEAVLTNRLIVRASSTLARWLLERGRARDAAILLGRAHELTGVVERGDRRGRELGFPTANLRCEEAPPADGVYAALADLPDGRTFPGALSVGVKPTFGDRARTVEAYVIGWSGPGAGEAEYGWPLRLRVIAHLRGQMKFASASSLVEQMERDVERALGALDRAGLLEGAGTIAPPAGARGASA